MRKNPRNTRQNENNFQNINWDNIATSTPKTLDLSAPFRFSDKKCEAVYNAWADKFSDEWSNNLANINAGNSIAQYSDFIAQRLNYSECAFLATDSIINNAISKYSNEILRRGGKIILDIENKDEQARIEKMLNDRLVELQFWDILKEAIETSLIYGGALIFIDTFKADDLSEPLYLKKEILSQNKLRGFRVIPPYLVGASEVETSNPLSYDYMKPSKWFVSGNSGLIDESRILTLTIFNAPLLLKPLYNFLGISLAQFMKNYVASADIARQSLSDIFLRFKTDAIKSDLIKINLNEAKARAESINRQRNNLGILLMTKDEELIQTITPLTGLDKLIAQFQENIAVSARMPAVKLLGLTPSGFNATGDFDLASYYDEIMSLQNAIIKPFIEKVLKILALELDLDLIPTYEFNIIERASEIDKITAKNAEADFVSKAIQDGILTSEQAFNHLKNAGAIDNTLEYDESDDELDSIIAEAESGEQESTN